MSKILPGTKTTRMELLRLRSRIRLAERGHDLLKEKRDSLIMEFFNAVAEIRSAREEAHQDLADAFSSLTRARMVMGSTRVAEFAYSSQVRAELSVSTRSLMGIRVPMLSPNHNRPDLPYSLTDSSAWLDLVAAKFSKALSSLVRLAELESTVKRLAIEIQRTKRRVSALETVVLPRLEATVQFVRLALEEREREDFYRIKLVKSLIGSRKSSTSEL
ncbi:MAG: V-type ATP synthase subunit D [Candidatus Thorarchaeota archaeon]